HPAMPGTWRVIKRQPFHRSFAEIDAPCLERRGIPSRSLRNHFMGGINSNDTPRRGSLSQNLNSHTGSEAYFEHVVARPDIKEIDGRHSHRPVHPRHDDFRQASQSLPGGDRTCATGCSFQLSRPSLQFGAMPLARSSATALSFFERCANRMPRRTFGALVNWMLS